MMLSFIGILTIELTPKLTDACFIAELELRKDTHFTHSSMPTYINLPVTIFGLVGCPYVEISHLSTANLTHNQGNYT